MNGLSIFSSISSESRARMYDCFGMTRKKFKKGQTVLTYCNSFKSVCVMITGSATLSCIDEDGNNSFLEKIYPNDVFGELFCLPLAKLEYVLCADEDCEVLFIDYDHIITPCSNTCEHHSRLINNLFLVSARKLQSLTLRINILTQKNIRKKLLAYLEFRRNLSPDSRDFTLDMSLTDLADYLSVDRASMMREIKALKEEQIIWSEGRKFRFINNDFYI